MPRTVSSKIHVPLSAAETWYLRCNFELEQHIASLGKRKLHLLEEEVTHEGSTDEQRQRLVQCELLGEPLGSSGGAMGFKTADLGSQILAVFFVHQFDEAHGGEFTVDMCIRRLNVAITGHQWCVPESDTSCFLCTRIDLEVKLTGIGGLVEMQLERQMRASHAAFPGHACAFARKNAAHKSPPPPLLRREPSECVDVLPTVHECPMSIQTTTTTTAELNLRQWRHVGTTLLRWALRRPRRHSVLTDSVPVRVHRQHARVLLWCGCASAMVDSDEIVE